MNYELLIVLLLGIAVGGIITWYVPRLGGNRKSSKEVSSSASPEAEVFDIASRLSAYFNTTSHPSDLLASAAFVKGVDIFYLSDFSDDRLIQYSTGSNLLISCMALEALQRRHLSGQAVALIAGDMGVYYLWPIFFALRAIAEDNDQPVIGAVLAQTQEWWLTDSFMPRFIEDFISERLENGEKPLFGSWLEGVKKPKTDYIKGFLSAG